MKKFGNRESAHWTAEAGPRPICLGTVLAMDRSVITGQLDHVPLSTPSPAPLTSLRGSKGSIHDGVSHMNYSHS